MAPPDPPPAAPTQPIRCNARSHHTAAARHWPLPRAPHHAVREVDTKADSLESLDSHSTHYLQPSARDTALPARVSV